MNRSIPSIFVLWALAALVFMTAPAYAQVTLGTAQNFAVLGGSTVTNTGASAITGDVGVSPGTQVTGFPPGVIIGGVIHAADAVAGQAQTDLTTAYNAVAGTACNVDLTGQDLGGLTLTPGVYCSSTSAQLTGTLTLDFQGNANSLFLFKIGSTLNSASGARVIVINSAGATCPSNLFWQVGSSATLGTSSSFAGNILALSSITLTTGAQLSGRALARNGAVTLDTNSVTRCGAAGQCPSIVVNPATLPSGSIGIAYNQNIAGSGGMAPYSYSVSSGMLPTGLTLNPATGAITGAPTTIGTFNFSITAEDANGCLGTRSYSIGIAAVGCPVITLNPIALPPGLAGTPYSQTITASGGAAPYTFAVTAGALPSGLVLNPGTGTLTGTPIASGMFNFTISATDANGCVGATTGLSITIGLGAPMGIPTLGILGLALLLLSLGAAGMLAMNRSI